VSAAGAVVAEVARRLVGGTLDVGDVVDKVKAELADELRDFEARVEAKLREQFAAVGLLIAATQIDEGPRAVLEAFDPPEHGTIPKLGLDIEIVDEITDEDRAREKASWDSLKTPPEGSSQR
jgi:hypothetical protein